MPSTELKAVMSIVGFVIYRGNSGGGHGVSDRRGFEARRRQASSLEWEKIYLCNGRVTTHLMRTRS